MSKFKVGDHVRILDGQDLPDYVGGWDSLEMGRCVGVEAVVDRVERRGDQYGVYLRGTKRSVDFAVRNFVWDERRLEKALHTKDGADQKIVLYRSGRSVIAKDYSTGKIAEAKCSPADKFDFHFGAALAFARVIGAEIKLSDEEKPKPEELKYYNGKVVCTKTGFGSCDNVDVTWWTVGKIYDVINGVIRDDDGSPRIPVESLAGLNRTTKDYAEFIALVG